MTYITIGYGTAAPIHHAKFNNHHVKPAGIIETNVSKHAQIESNGLRVCKSYEEAFQLRPLFWDICCPTDAHVQTIEKIVQLDPSASILVEKPVCTYNEIEQLRQILKNFRGKLVVNENYLSSETTKRVKEVVEQSKLKIRKVYVEMDKNRTQDFRAGRFIDAKGAFYYEGTHMVTILADIVREHQPSEQITKKYEDIDIDGKTLQKQGLADIEYVAKNIIINLFTSMKGDVKHSYSPHGVKNIPSDDKATRYRITAVKGEDADGEKMTVVGFYEPINGCERSQSAIAVLKKKQVTQYQGPFLDDTMGTHLKKAFDYFSGQSDKNPCPVDEGIAIVNMMNTLSP